MNPRPKTPRESILIPRRKPRGREKGLKEGGGNLTA